ncbi:protein GVQW3-like [Octopus sinensis]|uniref:Protein GVQW3-like n=1 Tax=Octopus sinensis TaxID=2607531 RepID=A0A6P7S900_9MOLL|nr:protein GVQW3-like [Octopus sinensis]
MAPSEIHEDMVRTLTDNAPSYATVKRWVNKFQRGRGSLEDDPTPGRPPTATTEDNIDLALGMIMQDRRISCRQIAERVVISTERADNIVTKQLGFSKVSARWVPRLLTPEQKRTRCTLSTSNLELFEADEENFLARFITMDESWVHHYQPETKEQSKRIYKCVYKHTCEYEDYLSVLQQFRQSLGKITLSEFLDTVVKQK